MPLYIYIYIYIYTVCIYIILVSVAYNCNIVFRDDIPRAWRMITIIMFQHGRMAVCHRSLVNMLTDRFWICLHWNLNCHILKYPTVYSNNI